MNTPYIQAMMAQAMQAVMTGAPLPSNCYVMSIPMEQAQQMFPPWLMAGSVSPMIYGPSTTPYYQPAYPSIYPPSYPSSYSPMIAPYTDYPQSNAVVPYNNPYQQALYAPNYNYPMLGYNKSKKKDRHRRRGFAEPHTNVYNSSSFDTHMENLSWSRLFGHHHHRRGSQSTSEDTTTPTYDRQLAPMRKTSNRDQQRSRSNSSTTTSDETIRRVNLATQQGATAASGTSSSAKQSSQQQQKQQHIQTKGSLPFKYSSDYVPGTGKQATKKSSKKDGRLRLDDVFIVQHPQPPSGH